MNSDRTDLISCAIIKMDIFKNEVNYGRSFNVLYDEIEDIIKLIKKASIDLNIPISRVYISGFALVSKNEIWTKDIIKDFFKMTNNDLIINEKTSRIK